VLTRCSPRAEGATIRPLREMESCGYAYDGHRAIFHVQHLTDCAMRFTEKSHGEAFTHHRHGCFRLELFGAISRPATGFSWKTSTNPASVPYAATNSA